MGEETMSLMVFACLSHIASLINSSSSGSLLQVQSIFDIVA